MTVNFEFFDREPIENVITCMNYKIQKVVFFGYAEAIQEDGYKTEKFLKEHCGVKEVRFLPVKQNDLQDIIKVMRQEVEKEQREDHQIYFDVTGGESLILVAFGMLSRELVAPMHLYNIVENKLIELDEDASLSISKHVEKQQITLNLDSFIEMHGGVINNNLHKGVKEIPDAQFDDDIKKMYQVAKSHWESWNPFSSFLRAELVPTNGALQVSRNASGIITALRSPGYKALTISILNEMLDELGQAGILENVVHKDGRYSFQFKNNDVKDCLWEGGSILELHVYQQEQEESKDCRIGVHLDWDGVIHDQVGCDVLNEIDVLTLSGNVPTFISCKSGKIGPREALHALYELQTVTDRFGGKYAKKVLVSAQPLAEVYRERAEEMGIEVKQLS